MQYSSKSVVKENTSDWMGEGLSNVKKSGRYIGGQGHAPSEKVSYSEIPSRPLLGQNSHYSPTKIFCLVYFRQKSTGQDRHKHVIPVDPNFCVNTSYTD